MAERYKKRHCGDIKDKDGNAVGQFCIAKQQDTGRLVISFTDEEHQSKWFDETKKFFRYLDDFDVPKTEREPIVNLINSEFRTAKLEEDGFNVGLDKLSLGKNRKRKMD